MAKQKKLSVPREMKEIQEEYHRLCINAGQVQYQLTVYQQELNNINERLRSINNEGAARTQLDKASKQPEVTNDSAKS